MGEKGEDEAEELRLAIQTFVLTLILISYIIIGPILRRNKINYIHESGATMIIGVVITLLVKLYSPDSKFFRGFQMNPTIFFTFIFPWIIYSAGFITKIESFLKRIKFITVYSLLGTLVTFLIISTVTYTLNSKQIFKLSHQKSSNLNDNEQSKIINLSLLEILQFSSALSASDCIASVSILMKDEEDKLNTIAFGDTIINNAISIALFNIVSRLSKKEKNFSAAVVGEIIFKCIIFFIGSFIIGAITGLIAAIFLKKMKYFHLNRVQEITILLLFAFISYILCDWVSMSPMIGLLACGLFMSHYTYYNLGYQTREEGTLITIVLSTLAEGLIFSNLGMTIVYFSTHAVSFSLIFTELVLIILSRAINIFGLTYIINLIFGDKTFKIKISHQGILTVIGSMRGAISFGLGVMIYTNNNVNSQVLVSSTIYIVFITNIVFTAFLPYYNRRMRMIDNQNFIEPTTDVSDDAYMFEDIFTFIHPNSIIKTQKKKNYLKDDDNLLDDKNNDFDNIDNIKENKSCLNSVLDYDEKVFLPHIVNNWPDNKIDNYIISKMIKEELKNWAKMKINNKKKDEDDDDDDVVDENNLYIDNSKYIDPERYQKEKDSKKLEMNIIKKNNNNNDSKTLNEKLIENDD